MKLPAVVFLLFLAFSGSAAAGDAGRCSACHFSGVPWPESGPVPPGPALAVVSPCPGLAVLDLEIELTGLRLAGFVRKTAPSGPEASVLVERASRKYQALLDRAWSDPEGFLVEARKLRADLTRNVYRPLAAEERRASLEAWFYGIAGALAVFLLGALTRAVFRPKRRVFCIDIYDE